jgi:hypothetical protein
METLMRHQRFHERRPRTTQERRENGKRNKWGRARRSQSNLPNAWDDKPITVQDTWKGKRRKQYREGGRGQQHEIFLPNDDSQKRWWGFWVNTWQLEQWFEDHDIPYRIEKVQRIERSEVKTHTRVYVVTGVERCVYMRKVRPKHGKAETTYETYYAWKNVYGWVTRKLRKPRRTTWSALVGYKVIWWSDKDIGIEYALQSNINN